MHSSTTITRILIAAVAVILSGCGLWNPMKTVGQTEGPQYTVTVVNALPGERLANILAVGDADESKIWVGDYVSAEAHTQFTTGKPGPLAEVLGGDLSIAGKVPVDGTITFTFRSKASNLRITAMVHPDTTPDNYVTALVPLSAASATVALERFDIGDDEGRKTVQKVGPAGTVSVVAN